MLLETIRCIDGEAENLSYHQRRLDYSIKKLGFLSSYNLSSLITPPDKNLYRCRFVYSDSSYKIEYIPYEIKKISSLKLVAATELKYELKYSDRAELNSLYDMRGSCDDVLITQDGELKDTTIANIALYINNRWLTPQNPLLQGTTRARLLDENKIFPAILTIDDIAKASKVAVFNAMIGFIVVENGIIL